TARRGRSRCAPRGDDRARGRGTGYRLTRGMPRNREADDRGLAQGAGKIRDRARRADANPDLVATAKLIRRYLPGDEVEVEGEDFRSTNQLRARLAQALAGMPAEQPSMVRELGFGVLQAWEALSEAQRRRRGTAPATILFTDLVGFSPWALE